MRDTCRHAVTAVTLVAAVATTVAGQPALAAILTLAAGVGSRLRFGKSLDLGERAQLLRLLQDARVSRAVPPLVVGSAWNTAMFVKLGNRRALLLRRECGDREWRMLQTALRLQREPRSVEIAEERIEGLPQTR